MNSKAVENVTSLVDEQANKEADFKIDGYTIDSPNVIKNPYGKSPLTALVIFRTTNSVSPTVTIEGDDDLTTFTHTFDSSTDHYLPIYGLYADRDNKVTISYKDGDQSVTKDITITTDKLPDNMVLPTEVKANKEKLANELYFFTPSSYCTRAMRALRFGSYSIVITVALQSSLSRRKSMIRYILL